VLTLPEELVLIGTKESGSLERSAWTSLDYGIAGARLLELALAGRLRLGEKSAMVVHDETPTGDELADEALATIAASERVRDAKHWVGKLTKGAVRKRVLARLDERGVLAAERGRFLGIVPRTRHVEVDPGPEREIRKRLRAAVTDGAAPDARTVRSPGSCAPAPVEGLRRDDRKGRPADQGARRPRRRSVPRSSRDRRPRRAVGSPPPPRGDRPAAGRRPPAARARTCALVVGQHARPARSRAARLSAARTFGDPAAGTPSSPVVERRRDLFLEQPEELGRVARVLGAVVVIDVARERPAVAPS
jgi:hypothetical protein